MQKNELEKSGMEILKEYIPEIKSIKMLFIMGAPIIGLLIFTYIFNLIDWWAPLVLMLLSSIITFYLMSILPKNAEKIRKKYINKYGDLAYRKFFYRHIIPILAPASVIEIMILMVKNNEFIPSLVPYGDHILYQPLIPWQVSLPVGLFILIFAILMARRSINGGFDADTELYLYIIYPEKSRKIQGGTYQYIRHAHYAHGVYLAISFAFLSQNIMGFILTFIFIVTSYFISRFEDRELERRYGESFKEYIKSKPMFFPKIKELGSFFKLVFTGK